MRINNNISAVNAYRTNSETLKRISRSTEKLTSGLRINRAGDDSAGLAISEKMRGQINGLEKSTKNSQDAVSLIQTAEGSLNETHTILQRMREMAVQSANDTNTNSDRAQLQKEMDRLRQEVDRIANNTEFNTKTLLTGEYSKKGLNFQVGANEGQVVELKFNDMRAPALGIAGVNEVEVSAEVEVKNVSKSNSKAKQSDEELLLDLSADVNGKNHEVAVDRDLNVRTSARDLPRTPGIDVNPLHINADYEGEEHELIVDKKGKVDYHKRDKTKEEPVNDNKAKVTVAKKKFSYTKKTAVDIRSSNSAEKAITVVNDAIEKVADERSRYGAMQNRLEHTIKNLNLFRENLAASESRIRDANMAMEIVSNSKDKIISQSGNTMLAQANAEPQKVLQLLG